MHSQEEARETTRTAWKAGIAQELAWWRTTMSQPVGAWPPEIRHRLDPDAPLQDHIARHLPRAETVRILDCAAGPLTILGKRHAGTSLAITAVDALADHYATLLKELGMQPPVVTRQCEVGALDSLFAAGTFDLVYMRFALDHCFDPEEALRQMIRATTPGGVVMVEHYRDVTQTEYAGLRQWDLLPTSDDLVVANPRARFSVRETFPEVAVAMETRPDWFTMVLRFRS